MPKVLCTSPNASEKIDGYKFEKHANGMLSEDMSAEAAARFATIPGYVLVGGVDPAEEAAKADLVRRAQAVEFKFKASWGLERLKTEVEAAEAAAVTAAAEAATKKSADADKAEGDK